MRSLERKRARESKRERKRELLPLRPDAAAGGTRGTTPGEAADRRSPLDKEGFVEKCVEVSARVTDVVFCGKLLEVCVMSCTEKDGDVFGSCVVPGY